MKISGFKMNSEEILKMEENWRKSRDEWNAMKGEVNEQQLVEKSAF